MKLTYSQTEQEKKQVLTENRTEIINEILRYTNDKREVKFMMMDLLDLTTNQEMFINNMNDDREIEIEVYIEENIDSLSAPDLSESVKTQNYFDDERAKVMGRFNQNN